MPKLSRAKIHTEALKGGCAVAVVPANAPEGAQIIVTDHMAVDIPGGGGVRSGIHVPWIMHRKPEVPEANVVSDLNLIFSPGSQRNIVGVPEGEQREDMKLNLAVSMRERGKKLIAGENGGAGIVDVVMPVLELPPGGETCGGAGAGESLIRGSPEPRILGFIT